MNFIGKILPNDGYTVRIGEELALNYAVSLTHLYQPLIGIQSIALYQTLLHEYQINHNFQQTHHTLMNYLNLPLNELYEARLRLEGIGLLKTIKNEVNKVTVYTYVIQRPFTPSEFFHDAMFSELLYHHIGKDKFLMLEKTFSSKVKNEENEITASFNKVFGEYNAASNMEVKQEKQSRTPRGIVLEQADFTWIAEMFKERMIPTNRILTSENQLIINQMLHLYDLTNYEIEKALLFAITEDNELNIEDFKESCHDLYRIKQPNKPIKLDINHLKEKAMPEKVALTKRDQLINHLEVISPRQLLEEMSSGNYASEKDVRLIREVMVNQGLPAPVMNVLIHYVLLQSNMRLSKAYIETIASHWSRANLKTAKQAMDFAKNEIANYRNPQKKTLKRQSTTKEVVPAWFKQRNSESNPNKEQKPIKDEDKLEKELAELAKLLEETSADK